jgi:putative DNA primase/helicase
LIDFKRLAADLLARADELVPAWLEGGKRSGREWICGDLSGAPGQSCSVNLDNGKWADFAAGVQGGDLISLYAAIHGLEQIDAAKELGRGDYDVSAPAAVSRGTTTAPANEPTPPEPLIPAPDGAPEPPAPRKGKLEAAHVYRLPTGAVVGVVQRVRLDDGDKTFRQWRWGQPTDKDTGKAVGGMDWIPKAMPEPRPLYGLERLAERPESAVLIVEGEKAADAAARALPRYVVVSWPGGAKAWKKAHWQVLADRKHVDIWPDADEPGREAAGGIAVELFRAGVPSVRIVDPTGQPEGWDVADAIAQGMGEKEIIEWARPRMRKLEKPSGDKDTAKKKPNEIPPRGLIQGTDMAFARRFHQRHGADVRYTVERGWLVWSGQKWQIDDKGIAVATLAKESAESLLDEIRDAADRNEAFKTAKSALQKRAVDSTMWLARSEPGVPARLVDFDKAPMILNVRNGIVDLTTGTLGPHDKTAMCAMIAGTEYDKHAQCSRWQQFIAEICCDSVELMDYVQRWCGYLLTANVAENSLMFLLGDGRNGKSLLIEVMKELLGEYAIVASTEMVMVRRNPGIPNDIARMRGVRAVFMNETNKGQRFDEAKVKDLTGGDTLNARFMREEFFDFAPTHKLVIRGNHKPTINGTDAGIWSRFKLVPFRANFLGREDMGLKAKLLAELPGILNWCLAGCLEWQRTGLVTPAAVADAVASYRNQSDTMGRFIEECCTPAEGAVTSASAMYMRYKDFCLAASERWLSLRDFPDEMARHGFALVANGAGREYQGIALARGGEWEGRARGDFEESANSGWDF